MSNCNCKKNTNLKEISENNFSAKKPILGKLLKYLLKFLMFIIFLGFLPFLMLYIVYLSFNMIVLNGNIDIKPLLLALGNKFKEKDDDDEIIDDEEFDNLTYDDVILLNAEDITDKEKQ